MKKILIAFDNSHFSAGAIEAARHLNETQPISLVGVFLPAVYYANAAVPAEGMAGSPFVPLLENEDVRIIQENIDRFEDLCKQYKITYTVHKNLVDAAIPSLKVETRFADLLIIGSQMFYKNLGMAKPNEYLRYALHEAECPVLLVPEKFEFPTNNILAYDGSEASSFAIKQFKYLFPQFCANHTMLLYISKKSGVELPDKSYIEEYARTTFNDLEIAELNIDARKYFSTWISEKPSSIVIAGSYGRSEFSEIFRKSFLKEVISDHDLPVFIAHK